MNYKVIIAIYVAIPMTGCTTTAAAPEIGKIPERGVTAGYDCNADALQFLVGQKATTATGARALQKSGARTLRWIAPGTAVTADYRQDRLNISYDIQMIIERVNCN